MRNQYWPKINTKKKQNYIKPADKGGSSRGRTGHRPGVAWGTRADSLRKVSLSSRTRGGGKSEQEKRLMWTQGEMEVNRLSRWV